MDKCFDWAIKTLDLDQNNDEPCMDKMIEGNMVVF